MKLKNKFEWGYKVMARMESSQNEQTQLANNQAHDIAMRKRPRYGIRNWEIRMLDVWAAQDDDTKWSAKTDYPLTVKVPEQY